MPVPAAAIAQPALVPVTEPSEAGEQMLVPGVAPISLRQRLESRMEAPLLPTRPQRPADFGLFDLQARNQLELFG